MREEDTTYRAGRPPLEGAVVSGLDGLDWEMVSGGCMGRSQQERRTRNILIPPKRRDDRRLVREDDLVLLSRRVQSLQQRDRRVEHDRARRAGLDLRAASVSPASQFQSDNVRASPQTPAILTLTCTSLLSTRSLRMPEMYEGEAGSKYVRRRSWPSW